MHLSAPAAALSAALEGRYRIERELGQGGMATVYLAHDLRHQRKVALKLLRPELAAVIGGERFLQEITTTANLQHPHILALFDSGQVTVADAASGDTVRSVFYVMPFVEGETLRERLTREKQLPVEEAVRIAGEVASALQYAHKRGVVHRDIKPENILLQDGRALVADFGIALAASTAGGTRLTETGLSLGTPQYMSPEQAMGERTLDSRSDVYALGCVSYEMLAGEAPFTGPTVQAVVARVLTEAPRSLRAARRTIPEHVEAAILRALEKLPADRFASAAEFADAVARPGAFSATAARPAGSTPVPPRTRLATLVPWVLAVGATGFGLWALTAAPAPVIPPLLRYTLRPPPELRVLDVGGSPLAIHPKGTGFVYRGGIPGRVPQLFRWGFDGGTPEPIPGTENASFPFFSPDGEWLAFIAGGQLRKVGLIGGGTVSIGGRILAGSFRGATWTPRGQIVFATSSGMFHSSADGSGTIDQIPTDTSRWNVTFFPAALPDGDYVVVALLDQAGARQTQLAVMHVGTGALDLLGQPGSNPRYVEPGFLTFTTIDGGLHAVKFDARRRRILSPARPIAQGLSLGAAGVGKFDVARNGTVVYLEGIGIEERQLIRVDRRGSARALDAPPRAYNGPRIAPDGRRIAVTIGAVPNPPMDVWIYDLVTTNLSRVTSDSTSVHAEWGADGRLYHRSATGQFRAFATTPDASLPPESLYTTTTDLWEVLPTRSGDTLITRELRSVDSDRDLMLVPLRPGGAAVPWAAGPRIQAEPMFSPDGKWLAYSSDESGSFEVYVRAFPGPGPRYQVTASGGVSPRWNPRGGELFHLTNDSLISVPVRQAGPGLEFGRGRGLLENRYAALNFHAPYDVAPDGTWFIFAGSRIGGDAAGFRLIHHWFAQSWP